MPRRRRQRIKLTSPMRRRRLISLLVYLVILVLSILFGVDQVRRTPKNSDDWAAFDHKSFRVTHVVDGDTIQIRSMTGDRETTVRLLGVDAPEMHDLTTSQPAHWGRQASNYLYARANDKVVTIRLEPIATRDKYDRLLAYVYLTDSDCVNLDLVRDGQAYADRRFRHSYKPQYEQAENEARGKERGLWKNLTEDQMPPWRRVWLHERDRDR
jgi:micrococcal nuclease